MNPRLSLIIYEALDKAINDAAESNLWDEYIHTNLVHQMTKACEQVFDAAQEAQRYVREECDVQT